MSTFADLRTQALDYLDRPELTDQFPLWVRLFQAKLNRLLRTGGGERQATLTPDPLTGGAALPDDYQAWRSVVPVSRPAWPLPYAAPDVLARERPCGPVGGIPRLFTIEGSTLFPAPVGQIALTYYRGVSAYVDGSTADWILIAHPDLYLYGVLTEAELYLKNDERAAMWQAQAANALADLMSADRDARWGRARVMMAGATP